MSKLNKEEALIGLQKLHALTKETTSLTRKELQGACGLRLTDMLVLTENEIISCISRKPTCWIWKQDVVPNEEMAERMLKTKVKAWYNRNNGAQEETAVVPGPTPVKNRIPGVKIFRRFEITKKYGEQIFTMTLEESGGGWKHSLADRVVIGSCSADRFRAMGFALVTAADIMDKEAAK